MPNLIFPFFVLISQIIYTKSENTNNEKILYLGEISRHGSATPKSNAYDLDWRKDYSSDQEITVNGLRQEHILGKQLSLKYKNFFDHYFLNSEIWARTWANNIGLQSAMSQLQGIFDKFKSPSLMFPNNAIQVTP